MGIHCLFLYVGSFRNLAKKNKQKEVPRFFYIYTNGAFGANFPQNSKFMKKLFALVAILSATLLSHAQITLERTLTNIEDIRLSNFGSKVEVYPLTDSYDNLIAIGEYLILTERADDGNAQYDPTVFVQLYNLHDFSLVFSVNIEQLFGRRTYHGPFFISKNIFTTDSKFAYICVEEDDYGKNGEFKIISQDGNIITSIPYTLAGAGDPIGYLFKAGDQYKLIVHNDPDDDYTDDYDIYLLPGNGEATDINEVYAPRRNARKYIHDAQVLIENEKNIYTIQGQEIK